MEPELPDPREHIEQMSQELADDQPSPGWEQMEQAARNARQQAGDFVQQGEDIPPQDVPESERLDRPVGTETDSY